MTGYCLQSLSGTENILLPKIKGYLCGNVYSTPPNEIELEYRSVSLQHCLFLVSTDRFEIVDLRSLKGTYINGVKIESNEPTVAVENDIIGIGCRKTGNFNSYDRVYKLVKYEVVEKENTNLSGKPSEDTGENSSNQLDSQLTGDGVTAEQSEKESQEVSKPTNNAAEAVKKSNKRARKSTDDVGCENKKIKKNGHADEEKDNKSVDENSKENEHKNKDKSTKNNNGLAANISFIDPQVNINKESSKTENSSNSKDKKIELEKKKSIVDNKRRISSTSVENQDKNTKIKDGLTSSSGDKEIITNEQQKNEVKSKNKNTEKKKSTSRHKRSSEESKKTLRKLDDVANKSVEPTAKKLQTKNSFGKSTVENLGSLSMNNDTNALISVENETNESAVLQNVPHGCHSEVISSVDVDNLNKDADSTDKTGNYLKTTASADGKHEKSINTDEEINDEAERKSLPSTSSQTEFINGTESLSSGVSNDETSEPLDFLLSILKWDPQWLNHTTYDWKSEDLPPFIEHEIIPQLTSYKKHDAYYKTMSTFVALELWTCIFKDFNAWDCKPALLAAVNKNLSFVPIKNETLTKLTVEILCDKEQITNLSLPKPEDLVILSDKQNRFKPVLAFVKLSLTTFCTKSTPYSYCLKNAVQNPHYLVTYKMITRSLPSNFTYGDAKELKIVYGINSYLQMISATLDLKLGPLGYAIVDPNANRKFFSLPEISNHSAYELLSGDAMDNYQKKAVLQIKAAIFEDQPKICLIDGPPGTGKSKVILNLVTEIFNDKKKDQKRILICSPFDRVIDELSIKLIEIRDRLAVKGSLRFLKIVRVGALETMHPKVSTEISINALLIKAKNAPFRDDALNESIEGEKNLLRNKIIKIQKIMETRNNMPQEEPDLLKIKEKYDNYLSKLQLLEDRYPVPDGSLSPEEAILNNANVILCTLKSCCSGQVRSASKSRPFKICIIDEATLCCEPEALLPLTLGVRQLILAGDSNQFSSINSKLAKKNNYHKSLFSRIYDLFELDDDNPILALNTQYRTASEIICWPKLFFNQKLNTVAPVPRNWQIHRYRVLDLASPEDNNLFKNSGEATFIVNLVYTIACSLAVQGEKIRIGLITPFEDQQKLLAVMENSSIRRMPYHTANKIDVTALTIDESRGQEFDMVIFSCVRSKSIEFLPDIQQLCHIFTRAKYSFFICGHFGLLRNHEPWGKLLKYAKEHDCYEFADFSMSATAMKKSRLFMKPSFV